MDNLEKSLYKALSSGNFMKKYKKKKQLISQNLLDQIFISRNFNDIESINISYEEIKTPEQLDKFRNYAYFASSYITELKQKIGVGKSLLFLVKNNDKYLGLLGFASDLKNIKKRDNYITNNKKLENENLQDLLNITICVPFQPFGFNTNGGKLLAMLAFSQEISQFYYKKYNKIFLGITVMSLNGKSIMYEKIKELKYLGNTLGHNYRMIDNNIFIQCKELLSLLGIEHNNKKPIIYSKVLQYLKLSKTILENIPRGIYFGYLYNKSKEMLNSYNDLNYNDILELRTSKEIFNDWLNNVAKKRYYNLEKNKQLKKSIVFNSKKLLPKKTIIITPNIKIEKRKYSKVKYDDEIIKKIIYYPLFEISNKNIAINLSKELNRDISIKFVERTRKNNIIDINIIHFNPKNASNEKVAEILNKKFNINIDKEYVKNIRQKLII